jgi:hypothetical protein
MKEFGTLRQTFSSFASLAVVLLATGLAQAQNHPHLFRQSPAPTSPGRNATAAFVGDVDPALLASVPDGLTISLPGEHDYSFERHSHQRRGARNSVWRGKIAGDSTAKATLTYHEGLLFGRIESGNEVYSIRSGANGRTIIERIDTDSFKPEWSHDYASRGQERVPPVSGDTATQGSSTDMATPSAADGGTVEIVLMSVYTPQARAAAGGTTQIQGQIQAAVDQANTAFINSNMIPRYFLAHTEEVAYNDSGNINTDLDWVTYDAGVAALRNAYSADMVSLIVENGGAYCGIGWIQRNPGSGFAPYAFQVTDRGCLPNSTLAHEHGHNMGMEHNPENSSVGSTPSSASEPWSFGHWVNGQFATIMTYNSICPSYCQASWSFPIPMCSTMVSLLVFLTKETMRKPVIPLHSLSLLFAPAAAAAAQTIPRHLPAIRLVNPMQPPAKHILAACQAVPPIPMAIRFRSRKPAGRRGSRSRPTVLWAGRHRQAIKVRTASPSAYQTVVAALTPRPCWLTSLGPSVRPPI